MKKLYIVEGESSIGAKENDMITWLVRAYDSKQDAYDHADSAEKFSMDNFNLRIPNPWDSQMSKASVSVYNVVECDYSTN